MQLTAAATSVKHGSSMNLPAAEHGSAQPTSRELRQKQIEQLGYEVNPPLSPTLLAYMDSFERALPGDGPLTADELEQLKPRLVEERIEAEKKLAAAQDSAQRREADAAMRAKRDSEDKEWEEAQEPIRQRLDLFAEQFIKDEWNEGASVDKTSCPIFAADALVYIRERFYQDLHRQDEELRSQGKSPVMDEDGKPPTRTLLLENMKYVYDSKIRPITEKYRKELFLCRVCETISRFYGFEGVIQHYAAKHTSALTLRNIVVYWRAEWPAESPFSTNHDALRREPFSRTSSVAPSRFAKSTPILQSPYAPPPPISTPVLPNIPRFASPMSDSGQRYATPTAYAPPIDAIVRGPVARYPDEHRFGSGDFPQPPQYSASQYRSPPRSSRTLASGYGDIITKSHMEELARSSTDTWARTAGISELTANIRVYMMIYRAWEAFMDRFHEKPNLALYIEVLRLNPSTQAIAHTQNLMCRVCNSDTGMTIPKELKMIGYVPLVTLLEHFLASHEGRPSNHGPPLSFKRDMVILPLQRDISQLQYSKGMDPDKMTVLANVFSDLFPEHYNGAPRRHTNPYSPTHQEYSRSGPPENIPTPWNGQNRGYGRGKVRSISMQQPNVRYQDPRPGYMPVHATSYRVAGRGDRPYGPRRGRSHSPPRQRPPQEYRYRDYEQDGRGSPHDFQFNGSPEDRQHYPSPSYGPSSRIPPKAPGPPPMYLPERKRDTPPLRAPDYESRSRSPPRRYLDHPVERSYRTRSPLAPPMPEARTYSPYNDLPRNVGGFDDRIERPASGPRSGQPSPGHIGDDRRPPYDRRPDSHGPPRPYYDAPPRGREPHLYHSNGPPRPDHHGPRYQNEGRPGYAGP